VSQKYKGKARASFHSFMYDCLLISGDCLLAFSEPIIGGFEGFDLTNPRGRFGGERFHLACPKLGLEDAILSHTILARFYISAGGFYTATGTGREGGRNIGGFQQGGRTILGE
jgi:hypothetical protein